MQSTTALDFLLVPRGLVGVLTARDLIVFSYLFTARSRATDYFWGKQLDVGAATGFGRTTVSQSFAELEREEIVEEAEWNEYSEPNEFGAKEHSDATEFYKIRAVAGETLSKAPAWLIALPNRKLCASAKVVTFLLGGMEMLPNWCGIGSEKAALAIGKSSRQYFRLLKKLSDVGAFESVARRHRHSTELWLSYSGPAQVRLPEMRDVGGRHSKWRNLA